MRLFVNMFVATAFAICFPAQSFAEPTQTGGIQVAPPSCACNTPQNEYWSVIGHVGELAAIGHVGELDCSGECQASRNGEIRSFPYMRVGSQIVGADGSVTIRPAQGASVAAPAGDTSLSIPTGESKPDSF